MKPAIVLVHGAFAEPPSWNKVIDSLAGAGHPVIAATSPLRSPAAYAAAVGDLLRTVDGPVVLVGHSYGGMAITAVPADACEITGLVYDGMPGHGQRLRNVASGLEPDQEVAVQHRGRELTDSPSHQRP